MTLDRGSNCGFKIGPYSCFVKDNGLGIQVDLFLNGGKFDYATWEYNEVTLEVIKAYCSAKVLRSMELWVGAAQQNILEARPYLAEPGMNNNGCRWTETMCYFGSFLEPACK